MDIFWQIDNFSASLAPQECCREGEMSESILLLLPPPLPLNTPLPPPPLLPPLLLPHQHQDLPLLHLREFRVLQLSYQDVLRTISADGSLAYWSNLHTSPSTYF